MSKQTINIGASPNDGTGTPLRTSFDYTNQNFTELYTAVGPSGNNIVVPGSATITGAATVGTTLGVTGVSSFAAGTALLPALTRTGDTNTGIYYPAADTFAVTTGGTERLRVDSTGKVGINNTAPQGTLTINNANDDAFVLFGNNASALTGSYGAIKASYTGDITNFGIAAAVDFIRNESSDGKGGDIYFKTNSAGESGATTKVIINGAGNIKMAVANKGIDFSINSNATGATSEILNDYEEGTWSPTVGGTATYTTQTGRYTKIGNRVYVNMRLEILLIGTGSSFLISGLPFTSGVTSNLSSASVGYFGNLAISANYIAGYIASGGSTVRMTGTTAASANITNGIAVIGNATDLALSFFYEV